MLKGSLPAPGPRLQSVFEHGLKAPSRGERSECLEATLRTWLKPSGPPAELWPKEIPRMESGSHCFAWPVGCGSPEHGAWQGRGGQESTLGIWNLSETGIFFELPAVFFCRSVQRVEMSKLSASGKLERRPGNPLELLSKHSERNFTVCLWGACGVPRRAVRRGPGIGSGRDTSAAASSLHLSKRV